MSTKEPEAKAEAPKGSKRCFVITPIGSSGSPERHHADWVLGGAIEPVFKASGYEVFRSDTIADPAMINDMVFEHVMEDDVCIADLTFLNANVFYELGVRHALQKPVIHIASSETRLPFDTSQHRVIFFDRGVWQSFESLKVELARHLEAIEKPEFKVSNPLTHARGRQKIAESADSKDQLVADLMDRVGRLERESLIARAPRKPRGEGAFLTNLLDPTEPSSVYVRLTADARREEPIPQTREGITAHFRTLKHEEKMSVLDNLYKNNAPKDFLDSLEALL